MEYQDFTIDLQSADGGGFEALVTQSPLRGIARTCFAKPLGREELEALLGSFDLPGEIIKKQASSLRTKAREFGERIFTALFRNELLELFSQCRDAVSRDGQGLRIRLRFRIDDPSADDLAAVPWEWLWDPQALEFIAIDPCTPVVREIAVPYWRGALTIGPPLRILVVDAAPTTMTQLGLSMEIDRIKTSLKSFLDSGEVDLVSLASPTPEAMRDALLDKEIHVLHFMGHADYDPTSGAGAIFFQKNDATGDQVDGEELAAFLKRNSSLRLIVLNACKTARHKGRSAAPLNHGVASAVLERTGVPAFIAHQCSISDTVAIEFSRLLYERIAKGESIDEAMTEVRLRLWRNSSEWGNSVLFLNGPSGRILLPKKPGVDRIPGRAERSRITKRPVRLGVRSINGWGKDMKRRNDKVLDLTSYFEGRRIKDKTWWQEKIFPELRDFLTSHVDERRPLLLDFAAHFSIAFAAGWLLEPKSGLDVRVRQRTGNVGEFEWSPQDGSDPSETLWLEGADRGIDPTAPDLAVALSVSQPRIADEAEVFIRSRGLPVGRMIDATIFPEPSGNSVRGGAHALRLAQALQPRIQMRFPHERGGRVHFFCSGPNALIVYLGQLASSLGKLVLYEYPFRAENSYGRYQKSIELPPPDEAQRVDDDW